MRILTTEEVMKNFSVARSTVMQMFSTKGSPAFKIGPGRGHWRVDEDKFILFLQKQSEQYKS